MSVSCTDLLEYKLYSSLCYLDKFTHEKEKFRALYFSLISIIQRCLWYLCNTLTTGSSKSFIVNMTSFGIAKPNFVTKNIDYFLILRNYHIIFSWSNCFEIVWLVIKEILHGFAKLFIARYFTIVKV